MGFNCKKRFTFIITYNVKKSNRIYRLSKGYMHYTRCDVSLRFRRINSWWQAAQNAFILCAIWIVFQRLWQSLFSEKTNKLLIPYLVFYILGDLFYWGAFKMGALPNSPKDYPVLDVLWGGTPSNLPIWFLLCLFNCYVIFLAIYRIASSKYKIVLYSLIAGGIGVSLSFLMPQTNRFFICNAFSSIPFFCLGYLLRNTTILQYTHNRIFDFAFGILIYCLSIGLIYYFPDSKFSVFDNTFYGNIAMSYVISILLVLSILLFCKSFKRMPYVSYIGRYSIIILLIHVPIMEVTYYVQRAFIHYEANWLRGSYDNCYSIFTYYSNETIPAVFLRTERFAGFWLTI